MSAHARALQTAFRVPGVAGVRSDIDAPDVLTDAEMFGGTAMARGPNGNQRTGVNTDGGVIVPDSGVVPDTGVITPDAGDVCAEAPHKRARSGVYYGTALPTYVPLTTGQIYAIGNFFGCSGTLINPTWVLTAQHCGLTSAAEFCIGTQANNANLCIGVTRAQLTACVLLQTIPLGIAGTLLGLPLGAFFQWLTMRAAPDYVGDMVLPGWGIALACIMYGVETIGRATGEAAIAAVVLVLGLVVGVFALHHLRRHPHALLELSIFRHTTMRAGIGARPRSSITIASESPAGVTDAIAWSSVQVS